MEKPRYPGIRVTVNGNQLVSYHTEARIADAGVFYPITPSTEGGELYQQSFAEGRLNVFGGSTLAVEAEGEHAAQGGAIAISVCGRRVVNFTSGQGVVYGVEQYYHAPGKCSTMVLEVVARALTKHALNVHCGHDDIYGALDTGWIMVFAKDAQQAADQALILRRVTELCLTPGMNIQDGFLTSHLERTFYRHEAELIREFLGAPDDVIECPTDSQRELFGPRRRRVPKMIDLANPVLLGPVQNQEHYMQGVVARRNNFAEPILQFLEDAHREFGRLTGRYYGLLTAYKTEDADTVFVSLGSAAENIEAAVDYLRERGPARVGSIHLNVIRPFPEDAVVQALAGKKNVIVLERTDEPLAGANPLGRDIRTALAKALSQEGRPGMVSISPSQMPRLFDGIYGLGSRDFRPEHILGAYEYATGAIRAHRRSDRRGRDVVHRARRRPSLRREVCRHSLAPARGRGRGSLPLRRRVGCHHHREEPGRDHRRLQRLPGRARPRDGRAGPAERDHPRQRQPQVRVREEGRAHVVLPGGGPRADPGELRPATRHRRSLLRPQGLHPLQSARRDGGRAERSSGSPRKSRPRPGSGCPAGPGR